VLNLILGNYKGRVEVVVEEGKFFVDFIVDRVCKL